MAENNVQSTLASATPVAQDSAGSAPLPAPAESVNEAITPLPTLRAPRAVLPVNDKISPFPTLRAPRAASPVEDEILRDGYEPRLDTFRWDLNMLERKGPIQNPPHGSWYCRTPGDNNLEANLTNAPVASGPAPTPSAAAPATIAATTQRPMTDQTMRSFQARTASSASAAAAPSHNTSPNSSGLGRTSSVVVTFNEITPSDVELYKQANCLAAVKGEKVPQHRERTDENELRIITHIVTILRRIEELERKTNAQHSEVLVRLKDVADNRPAAHNTSPVLAAEVASLKTMTLDRRSAIGSLTSAVNCLVDLPRDVASMSRTIRNLFTASVHHHASSAPIHTPVLPVDAQVVTSKKRDAPFEGFNDPTAKRARTETRNEANYTDVPVDTTNTSPGKIAQTAIKCLKIRVSNPFISVQHPRNTPSSVISMRFRSSDTAELFIDTLRSDPPDSMKSLHAAKRVVYEKKSSGTSDKGSAARNPCFLRIVMWNVNGRLAVKITQPDFVAIINDNDIVVFEETFLRIGEELTLELPPGFEIVAMSRPDAPGLKLDSGNPPPPKCRSHVFTLTC
ncbi:hypothetical protein DFH07DRAFT_955585 [Mycena maculata]|uniref:Uncharacterized protein n=1 Tax=Mycena maculata TaxID=230809 RepID=A0AAD7JJ87_9AGAR|nr:hypothetical protein DFH07DRAFT_955585 [Mycena maculata]